MDELENTVVVLLVIGNYYGIIITTNSRKS